LKKLETYINENELTQLSELIGKKIWFLRSPRLSINLNDKTFISSYFRIPFFWKDEYDNLQSKYFEFRVEWNEDSETQLDYYKIKTKITKHESWQGDFESYFEERMLGKLNSVLSFDKFVISEIQILSRDEKVDDEAELKYDEGILLIDPNKNKILLAAELHCTDEVVFICDMDTIEKRMEELKIRKTMCDPCGS